MPKTLSSFLSPFTLTIPNHHTNPSLILCRFSPGHPKPPHPEPRLLEPEGCVVAFNREVRTPSVTLEGDIFQPSGLLTGGSRKQLHELAEAELKLSEHQKRLTEIEAKIREIQPLHKKFMELKQQLELKSYDLKLFQGRAEQNEHHKLGELVKRIELELQEANTAAKEKKLLHEDCLNKVSFLEKSIKENDNSREGRLKDLEKKIKETKALLQSASKDLKVSFIVAEI
ncbi:hypothetical protein ACLB2K_070226 [Fragaria x ananassa]